MGIPISHTLSHYLPPDFSIIPIAVLSGLSNVEVTPPSNNTFYTKLYYQRICSRSELDLSQKLSRIYCISVEITLALRGE